MRRQVSSIEKLNVGQQESLGVKELVRLSNEQIDAVITEVRHGHAFQNEARPRLHSGYNSCCVPHPYASVAGAPRGGIQAEECER